MSVKLSLTVAVAVAVAVSQVAVVTPWDPVVRMRPVSTSLEVFSAYAHQDSLPVWMELV